MEKESLMNNRRRDRLKGVLTSLENAQNTIEAVTDQEEDALDNIPENLMDSEMYDKIDEAVENLNAAQEKLQETIESIERAMR